MGEPYTRVWCNNYPKSSQKDGVYKMRGGRGKIWSCQAWRADSAFIGAFWFIGNSKGEGSEVGVGSDVYSKDHWRQEEKVLESSCLSSWELEGLGVTTEQLVGAWRVGDAERLTLLGNLPTPRPRTEKSCRHGREGEVRIAPRTTRPCAEPSRARSTCLARTA